MHHLKIKFCHLEAWPVRREESPITGLDPVGELPNELILRKLPELSRRADSRKDRAQSGNELKKLFFNLVTKWSLLQQQRD